MIYFYFFFSLSALDCFFSPLCHHHGIVVTVMRREAREKALLNSHISSKATCLCSSSKSTFCHQFCTFFFCFFWRKSPSARSKHTRTGERKGPWSQESERSAVLYCRLRPLKRTNKWCVACHYCVTSPAARLGGWGRAQKHFACMTQRLQRQSSMNHRVILLSISRESLTCNNGDGSSLFLFRLL